LSKKHWSNPIQVGAATPHPQFLVLSSLNACTETICSMPILKDMAFTKHSSISQVNKTAKGNIKYVAPQEKKELIQW
jgi:hypothetical protein